MIHFATVYEQALSLLLLQNMIHLLRTKAYFTPTFVKMLNYGYNSSRLFKLINKIGLPVSEISFKISFSVIAVMII